MSCGVGRRCNSDPELRGPGHSLGAQAPFQPLNKKPPNDAGVFKKRKKKKKDFIRLYWEGILGCLWPIILLVPYLVTKLRVLGDWHLSAKMDSSAKDPGRLVVSSLPNSALLDFRAEPHSLSNPPIVKQLLQESITVSGHSGLFQSVVP